jgi:gluconolactonase
MAMAAAEPSFERLDPGFDELVAPEAAVEVLATGFSWAEGPVWSQVAGELLFSDIPNNVIMAWSPRTGLREFLQPAGFTGIGDYGREPGSNGLTFDAKGALLLAEHGDRRIARLPQRSGKLTVADRWEGKRFNSPNDLVVHSGGAIYFTDPVYGLPEGAKDPGREMDFSGVFRIDPNGVVALVTKEMDAPNGIALAPDEKTLYVGNSSGKRPVILAFPLKPDGSAGEPRVFFDATGLSGQGGPDGLKVDALGNIWSTGPGGLLVISPAGKLLGRVLTGRATANIAFGGSDGKSVFITASDRLLRFARR